MGMDKGGFSFDLIVNDENSYANLARLFHEIYIIYIILHHF